MHKLVSCGKGAVCSSYFLFFCYVNLDKEFSPILLKKKDLWKWHNEKLKAFLHAKGMLNSAGCLVCMEGEWGCETWWGFYIFIFCSCYACFVCFINLLRTERCSLYHNGTGNANEMTFFAVHFSHDYFLVLKCIFKSVISVKRLLSCWAVFKFIMKNCKWY